MKNGFEQIVMNKIKSGGLEPKPRWHFLLKEWLVCLAGVLAFLVGAGAVSVMIFLANNNDLEFYRQAGHSFIGWLMLSLPYFWIIFLAVFIWLLYYNIKHTKKGYRYPAYLIAIIAIFASILSGTVLFGLGIGEKIDAVLGRRAPFYDRVFNPHIDMWSHPEDGRLAGLVVSNNGNDSFVLVDRSAHEWQVVCPTCPLDLVAIGQPLRMLGRQNGDSLFVADKAMPMRPGREFFKRLRPGLMPPGPGPAVGQPGEFKLENLDQIMSKYPDLRAALEKVILEHRDDVKEAAIVDPNFISSLRSLGVSTATIDTILK